MSTVTLDQALYIALQHHQAGRLAEAEGIYRQILAHDPNFPPALHLLGVLAGQVGKLDTAIDLIRRAIVRSPGDPTFHSNLGKFLTDSGQPEQAARACREALRLNPQFPDAHHNLGKALQAQSLFEEAIASYREALRLQPNPEVQVSLGTALNGAGRHEESVTVFRQLLFDHPDQPEAHCNLGNALREAGHLDEAIGCFQNALSFLTEFPLAHYNLAVALQQKKQFDPAIAAYREALRLQPDYPQARSNLANLLKDVGNLDEAVTCFAEVLAQHPDLSVIHSNILHTIHFHPGYDSRAIRDEARKWNQCFAEPLGVERRSHANDRDPNRLLRIGYISPDFTDHCQSFFTIPLLSAHDRSQFHVTCYANMSRDGTFTQRIQGYAHQWRNISSLPDARVAELIREDQIDILVDLTMHMQGNRLLVMARKPAPVQVTWLAYPGTTGVEAIDYRLTDIHLDPPGEHDGDYAETSIRLPDTFWCYDPLTTEPAINAPPFQKNGYITFGCLNNFCKVNDGVITLWCSVMQAVKNSRLMLLAPEGSHRAYTLEVFQNRGIAPERIEFVAPRPRIRYLALYHQIDIGLDTFPYNGHTTSLDSFWMGVPVITEAGPTVVGRAGLCQLMNLNLPQLIAYTPEAFIQIAKDLADDTSRLTALRAGLRERMQKSPLMDASRFARNVEAAYRQMWKTWCERPT